MALLSPMPLPPRRPSGGDSAGARSRDASAARLYALSNVFRSPCLRCRRNKLICWGVIVPTGGTPHCCGDCLTAGKGKDCDVSRDQVGLPTACLELKTDRKFSLEWSGNGPFRRPNPRRSAFPAFVGALAAWSSSWMDRCQYHFAPAAAAAASTAAPGSTRISTNRDPATGSRPRQSSHGAAS